MVTDGELFCGTALANGFGAADAPYAGFPECGGVVWGSTPEYEPAAPVYGRRPSMADYDYALEHFRTYPDQIGGLSHLRSLAIAGLRAGSLRAHDVLCRMRPAAVAVTVLAEQEVASEAGRLVAARIRAGAGDSPARWARLFDHVGTWEGTLFALLTGADDGSDEGTTGLPPSRHRAWTGHLWRPANVLMALAPEECVRRYFFEGVVRTGRTGIRRSGVAQQAAGAMPLCRGLVDHVVNAAEGRRARESLAGNAFTPDSVLELLVRRAGEPGIGTAVRRHGFASGAVRNRAFLAVRNRPQLMRESLRALLEDGQQQFLDLLAVASEDPDAAWAYTLVKLAEDDLERDARRVAYLCLATASEPEVVWSLELALAGSLPAMLPEVRDSMATGSVAPLAEAVRADPFRDPHAAVNAAVADMRAPDALDQPLKWLD
jgi:hypothetical protein